MSRTKSEDEARTCDIPHYTDPQCRHFDRLNHDLAPVYIKDFVAVPV